jgi:Phytanoyl-CoA dioxygenase (PhyH)
VTAARSPADNDPVTEPVDVDAFLRDGYLVRRGAFSPAIAAACRDAIWAELAGHGVARDDRATWTRPVVRVNCPEGEPFAAAGEAPALIAVYDRLLGPGRWVRRGGVGGTVPVRFPSAEDPGDAGYHVEGSYAGPGGYWTNVRSRDRGLLALFLFSDVGPDDAPTRLIAGSHLFVPDVLAPYGEAGTYFGDVTRQLRPSILSRPAAHATGRAGDVFVCHPFLVHTATWPHRGAQPRLVAQPGVAIGGGGFALDGTDPSPVARAIVAGLGTGSRSLFDVTG